jgi:hypothetical protein
MAAITNVTPDMWAKAVYGEDYADRCRASMRRHMRRAAGGKLVELEPGVFVSEREMSERYGRADHWDIWGVKLQPK